MNLNDGEDRPGSGLFAHEVELPGDEDEQDTVDDLGDPSGSGTIAVPYHHGFLPEDVLKADLGAKDFDVDALMEQVGLAMRPLLDYYLTLTVDHRPVAKGNYGGVMPAVVGFNDVFAENIAIEGSQLVQTTLRTDPCYAWSDMQQFVAEWGILKFNPASILVSDPTDPESREILILPGNLNRDSFNTALKPFKDTERVLIRAIATPNYRSRSRDFAEFDDVKDGVVGGITRLHESFTRKMRKRSPMQVNVVDPDGGSMLIAVQNPADVRGIVARLVHDVQTIGAPYSPSTPSTSATPAAGATTPSEA